MNIDAIKIIVESGIPASRKRYAILQVIACDENAIPEILEILQIERKQKKELLLDMNALLSQTEAALRIPEINTENFINEKVKQFYLKNKDQVSNCYGFYTE